MKPELTPRERHLKLFLKCLVFLSVVDLFFHLVPKWEPAFLRGFLSLCYPVLAGGSLAGGFFVALLLVIAAGDQRRFSMLVRTLGWFFAAGFVWSGLHWIFGKGVDGLVAYKTIAFAVLTVALWLLFSLAERARYGLTYLSGLQFQSMQALAEVCVAGDSDTTKLEIEPVKVATNVDFYLSRFDAKSKWVMKLVLSCMEIYPLLSLHVPLSLMLPDDRLIFLKRRFLTDEEFTGMPDWYRQLIQAAIRMSKQLCYMGYYSDKGVFKSIGYAPFSERKDFGARMARFPDNFSQTKHLLVEGKEDISASELTADVVIIGSGAGASILAHQLVAAGREVLLVERGAFRKPVDFSENEIEMVSTLYSDGALQLSRDFRFQVFQGSCVGGSTVVNNAVCFETPSYILDKWINRMHIGLDRARYERSMHEVYKLIDVLHTPQMTANEYLNPGGRLFSDACARLGYGKPELDSVMANIKECLGCGYCNMGCHYGRKLSMLDRILPEAQRKNPGALRIIAGCEALHFNRKGDRIVSVTAQFGDGRKLLIKGNTFVSSAGAISSSILLIKSKLGIAQAGLHLAFNLGSQLTAAYGQVVNSFDGLQISHFLKTGDRRYVMETWYNPPMFQSTAMPGWFDQHFRNMQDYAKMACTGVLVGTSSNAQATAGGLLGRNINYTPTEDDFNSLMDGLEKAAEIYFAGGVERVMPNSFTYYEYKHAGELRDRLRKDIKSSRDISTGTGHPQGGNVLSEDRRSGVVDSGFKVHGFANLFVCDASVFPTSLGVNPQVTVMSLAHYAAPLIAGNG